jgi:hypothetical protein
VVGFVVVCWVAGVVVVILVGVEEGVEGVIVEKPMLYIAAFLCGTV